MADLPKRLALPFRWGLRLAVIVVLLVLFWLAARLQDVPYYRAFDRRVVVLGFDGVDSDLLEKWMATEDPENPGQSLLPNLTALAARGTYSPLMPTIPAQSPVSWSSFATGTNPGQHGIFDFLLRDPNTYTPVFAMLDSSEAEFLWDLIPTTMPKVWCTRKGTPFWDLGREIALRARGCLLIGKTADAIRRAVERGVEGLAADGCRPHLETMETTGTLEAAVERAAELAAPGDVVLLSPACASYDQFLNFVERGERFREFVRRLGATPTAE